MCGVPDWKSCPVAAAPIREHGYTHIWSRQNVRIFIALLRVPREGSSPPERSAAGHNLKWITINPGLSVRRTHLIWRLLEKNAPSETWEPNGGIQGIHVIQLRHRQKSVVLQTLKLHLWTNQAAYAYISGGVNRPLIRRLRCADIGTAKITWHRPFFKRDRKQLRDIGLR